MFRKHTKAMLVGIISGMNPGNSALEYPHLYLYIHFCPFQVVLFLSKMSFLSAFEPQHLENRGHRERRGKVKPQFKPLPRCLPFAVHLGFWDKSCPRHHDCCLPGLQRKRGEGWKAGQRSLKDGPHVPLSSVERKDKLNGHQQHI